MWLCHAITMQSLTGSVNLWCVPGPLSSLGSACMGFLSGPLVADIFKLHRQDKGSVPKILEGPAHFSHQEATPQPPDIMGANQEQGPHRIYPKTSCFIRGSSSSSGIWGICSLAQMHPTLVFLAHLSSLKCHGDQE